MAGLPAQAGGEGPAPRDRPPPRKTTIRLADGRALMYFGAIPERPDDYPDRRQLPAVHAESQARWDQLLSEWVVVASHRQDRTFQPAAGQCPLCPSTADSWTEIPAPEYEVVVFENRFPALGADETEAGHGDPGHEAGQSPGRVRVSRPAAGRCEVVCFSQHHDASFADLSPAQAATVMAAWVDRSAELSRLPGVEQVYCFENRGEAIGVTLSHPHGQIYAYPYVTPRTDRMLQSVASYQRETGRNLFDDTIAAERADSARVVAEGSHWIAFVPYAAHWPYEVHLYPSRRVPDLASLDEAASAEFCELYLDLLRRFDRLLDAPAPYISAWHQAPVRHGAGDFALHLELFTVRRAPGKLKYLAGSESGMGAFANDVSPEAAASQGCAGSADGPPGPQRSLRAPGEGRAGVITGGRQPCRVNLAATRSVTAAAAAAGASAITDPPKPPPVIRAPSAPASRAACTAASASGHDTSKSSRSDSCDAVSCAPTRSSWPARSSSAVSSTRWFSVMTCRARRRSTGSPIRSSALTSVTSRSDRAPRACAACSHAIRRAPYPPSVSSCCTRVSMTSTTSPAAAASKGTDLPVPARQSSSSAWPASDSRTASWSITPVGAPAKSFSARRPITASCSRGTASW